MVNQLKMADTQTILALHAKGWSARRIARELKVDRETVGRHIRLQREADSKPANAPPGSEGLGKPANASSGSEGPAKPANVPTGSERLAASAGSTIPAATSSRSAETGQVECRGPGRRSSALPWRAVILQKLEQGLDAQRIYQDLTAAEHGYQGTYYSVRRLAAKLSQYTKLPVRRMECAPGVEAQVDFGRGDCNANPGTSRPSAPCATSPHAGKVGDGKVYKGDTNVGPCERPTLFEGAGHHQALLDQDYCFESGKRHHRFIFLNAPGVMPRLRKNARPK